MDLFIILTLEEEVCVFNAKLQSQTICGMDMLVLWESSGSYLSLCFTMLMEGSTETELKSALTS